MVPSFSPLLDHLFAHSVLVLNCHLIIQFFLWLKFLSLRWEFFCQISLFLVLGCLLLLRMSLGIGSTLLMVIVACLGNFYCIDLFFKANEEEVKLCHLFANEINILSIYIHKHSHSLDNTMTDIFLVQWNIVRLKTQLVENLFSKLDRIRSEFNIYACISFNT